MRELVEKLNQAAKVYYQGKDELMSNYAYDQLYDELQGLEERTGIILGGSPTQRVGYQVLSELPKEAHPIPMLSLDKTKEVSALEEWIGDQAGILSWKMDGLTVVLTYEGGTLVKAVTRGNGQVGEVITNNAKVFQNVPLKIPFLGQVVLRGEAVITYSEFERINRELPEQERYKNPRNLCSGSVRQLNNEITAQRNVQFFAFALVSAEGADFHNSQKRKYEFMREQGFHVVEYREVHRDDMRDVVNWFSERIVSNDFPSDGLVLLYDDIAYGESLGSTAKFPRNAIAFKWADEVAQTTLLEMEWSASRTGLINPVAIFEPVELEGTTVSRASVHNVSIVKELELGIGDTIEVYKANMIIPQIAENLTRSGNLEIARHCPVCGGPTRIHRDNDVEVLLCDNEDCLAKKVKSISHFVSRDAMNIEGMSEATIEKFLERGILHCLGDIFRLEEHRDAIVEMEGFGEKSFERLVRAAEIARETTVARFLYSLGIPNIGPANARMICQAFGQDFDRIRHATEEELVEVDGVGEVIAQSFEAFFAREENGATIDDLLSIVTWQEQTSDGGGQEQSLEGMNFVVTGSVERFANRSQVKEAVQRLGGKVTGSVTSKTDYLINNDIASNSSKNKKAKELNVPIITEEEFIERWVTEELRQDLGIQ
ncbi:MAG: NAD-dependent DNA ligase LigA [Lachnospiraceae bacterium]|nr:NAD-dependent DNA ligase LigA [Lachnospiraceae bacterium]